MSRHPDSDEARRRGSRTAGFDPALPPPEGLASSRVLGSLTCCFVPSAWFLSVGMGTYSASEEWVSHRGPGRLGAKG